MCLITFSFERTYLDGINPFQILVLFCSELERLVASFSNLTAVCFLSSFLLPISRLLPTLSPSFSRLLGHGGTALRWVSDGRVCRGDTCRLHQLHQLGSYSLEPQLPSREWKNHSNVSHSSSRRLLPSSVNHLLEKFMTRFDLEGYVEPRAFAAKSAEPWKEMCLVCDWDLSGSLRLSFYTCST